MGATNRSPSLATCQKPLPSASQNRRTVSWESRLASANHRGSNVAPSSPAPPPPPQPPPPRLRGEPLGLGHPPRLERGLVELGQAPGEERVVLEEGRDARLPGAV